MWVKSLLFAVLTPFFLLSKRTGTEQTAKQGMIQSNNKHANTCVVSNDDSVSTCKAMAFFMDRYGMCLVLHNSTGKSVMNCCVILQSTTVLSQEYRIAMVKIYGQRWNQVDMYTAVAG